MQSRRQGVAGAPVKPGAQLIDHPVGQKAALRGPVVGQPCPDRLVGGLSAGLGRGVGCDPAHECVQFSVELLGQGKRGVGQALGRQRAENGESRRSQPYGEDPSAALNRAVPGAGLDSGDHQGRGHITLLHRQGHGRGINDPLVDAPVTQVP